MEAKSVEEYPLDFNLFVRNNVMLTPRGDESLLLWQFQTES